MFIYLLLFSGVFMGWSLGTNDAANVFGTAVSTRVIKYSTAIIIIAVCVIIGAGIGGDGNIVNVRNLATLNGLAGTTVLSNAIMAAIILFASGATVTLMSYLKLPVSANQCITGAIIGWGIFNSPSWEKNLPEVTKFLITWFVNPISSMVICFVLVMLSNRFLVTKIHALASYDKVIKVGYILAGIYTSYTMGTNSVANVTALYVGTKDIPNLLSSPKLAALIGGIAIALGVLTYSKKVMFTVGKSITELSQINGFLVVLATGLTVQIFSSKLIGINIPVSTSQAVVGAVIGAGLTNGVKAVDFSVLKRIFIAWFGTPFISGVMTFLVSFAVEF